MVARQQASRRTRVPLAGTAAQRPRKANRGSSADPQDDFSSDERESACKPRVLLEAADERRTGSPESVRPDADEQGDSRDKKDLQMQAFSRAAEGIRTLDLLHGKQGVGFLLGADIACKCAGSGVGVVVELPRLYRQITGVCGPNVDPRCLLRGGGFEAATSRLRVV